MASAINNHFSQRSKAKTNDKSTNLRKNGSIGIISDVVTASVYSEKTRMKKFDDDENDNYYY